MLLLGVGMNVALARWGGTLGLSDRTDGGVARNSVNYRRFLRDFGSVPGSQ